MSKVALQAADNWIEYITKDYIPGFKEQRASIKNMYREMAESNRGGERDNMDRLRFLVRNNIARMMALSKQLEAATLEIRGKALGCASSQSQSQLFFEIQKDIASYNRLINEHIRLYENTANAIKGQVRIEAHEPDSNEV